MINGGNLGFLNSPMCRKDGEMARKRRTSSAFQPGSKISELYLWLKREMKPAGKLIFTSDQARKLKEELSIERPEFVWNMLRAIERRGFIRRRRRPGRRGIIISFVKKNDKLAKSSKADRRRRKVAKKSKGASKTPITINDLIKKTQSEIDGLVHQRDALGKRIEEKSKFLKDLSSASI